MDCDFVEHNNLTHLQYFPGRSKWGECLIPVKGGSASAGSFCDRNRNFNCSRDSGTSYFVFLIFIVSVLSLILYIC